MKPVLVLVLTVSVSSAASIGKSKNGRSSDSDISEVPYLASLEVRGSHICSGAILSRNRVLTAAQCTDSFTDSPNILSVRAGSTYAGTGGQVVQVTDIVQHPDYDEETMENDISILFLQPDLEFGPTVQSISLAPEGTTWDEAYIAGWGGLQRDAASSTPVRKVITLKCRIIKEDFKPEDLFCYNSQGDPCPSDPGSPFVNNGQVVGLVSWGAGCGTPGRFTDVYEFSNIVYPAALP